MSERPPAFQLYAKQWLGDDNILLMDWDARGMHMHLMCIAWQQSDACTLPNDDKLLRKWVGNPREWTRLKEQIFRAWKLIDERWVQEGLLRTYLKQKQYSDSRKKGAEARWEKEKKEKKGLKNQQNDDAHAVRGSPEYQCTRNALQSSSSSSINTGEKSPGSFGHGRKTHPRLETFLQEYAKSKGREYIVGNYAREGGMAGQTEAKVTDEQYIKAVVAYLGCDDKRVASEGHPFAWFVNDLNRWVQKAQRPKEKTIWDCPL